MADQILDQIRDGLEMPIDFEGQRLAEQLATIFLAIVGAVSFVVGYMSQNIHYTLWTGLGGSALAFVLAVPPWPFFNSHAVKWLPPRSAPAAANVQIQVDGISVK